MLLIALIALMFAWVVRQSRRVALIDLGPPDLIAVGDQPHTLASLQSYIRGSGVEEAVVSCPGTMPHSSVLQVLRAIEGAGVNQIRLTNTNGPPNLALLRPAPAAAASGSSRVSSGGPVQ